MALVQHRLGEGRIQSIRLPHAGALLLAGVIVVLMAVVAYALQHEFARQPAGDAGAPAAGAAPARALSADEEAYAAALWPIHREVKLAVLGMSFAGISYKTNGENGDRLEADVEPLAEGLRAATAKARDLKAPASMQELHDRYLKSLALYATASSEMLETARDGRDEHLIKAQGMSLRASEDVLRVGDVLWPGEYKPH